MGQTAQPATGSAKEQAWRAQIVYFEHAPERAEHAIVHLSDGLLWVADGVVKHCGDYASLAARLTPEVQVHDWRDHLLCPGFIDTHLHYPQTDIIASPAPGLLPWLENYTFPAEERFGDPEYAAEVAQFFLRTLLASGTTSAMVYCTVHPESAEAFFQASAARNTRMIAGKVLMDRNCPEGLRDSAEGGVRDSEALARRWHGNGRQLYALTPRFAPTSSTEQMALCAEMLQSWPDLFLQTHVAENLDEIKWVMDLYPGHRSYLDIYDRYGMLRPRAVYGHCVWLDDEDRARLRASGATAAFCPTSNMFLGSGLFDYAAAQAAGVNISLASDVGGGTSFSMLQTMAAAHKVARLRGHYLSAQRMFWDATQGAAQMLGLNGQIGTLAPGAEADFIILDPAATPLLARRAQMANSLEELLFALVILGDDRAVAATVVAGEPVAL